MRARYWNTDGENCCRCVSLVPGVLAREKSHWKTYWKDEGDCPREEKNVGLDDHYSAQ